MHMLRSKQITERLKDTEELLLDEYKSSKEERKETGEHTNKDQYTE